MNSNSVKLLKEFLRGYFAEYSIYTYCKVYLIQTYQV